MNSMLDICMQIKSSFSLYVRLAICDKDHFSDGQLNASILRTNKGLLCSYFGIQDIVNFPSIECGSM